MTETIEQTAERLAEQGRDALVERLRPAFAEAAAAHADVIQLDPEQLEGMVQSAADRADGLQWRRALASVASRELGITLGEALGHPAVARAQTILGVPSYEESLAQLGQPARVAEAASDQPTQAHSIDPEGDPEADPEGGPEGEEEADGAWPDRPEPVAAIRRPESAAEEAGQATDLKDEDEDEDEEYDEQGEEYDEDEEYDDEQGEEEESPAPETDQYVALDERGTVRLGAIHLGGIANLTAGERQIELRLSADGIDIVRGTREILGRLRWREVQSIDIPEPRSRRQKRRFAGKSHLVIRTPHGAASFEIPAVTVEQLHRHVDPLLRRYKRR
ncbi:MAG: hypothetical protein ACYC91_06210 [Solirubrobacteraceae bacterium]